jgi:hypothetical protein
MRRIRQLDGKEAEPRTSQSTIEGNTIPKSMVILLDPLTASIVNIRNSLRRMAHNHFSLAGSQLGKTRATHSLTVLNLGPEFPRWHGDLKASARIRQTTPT